VKLRGRLARAAAQALDEARSRLALQGATRVGVGVRVFGRPHVTNHGELTIGRHVALVSRPSPVELLVSSGGTLVLGEGALVESGASIRVRARVVIGAGARIGAGCIVDDEASNPSSVVVGEGAWIDEGVVLVAGANVPAGAHVEREVLRDAAANATSSRAHRSDRAEGTAASSAEVEDVDRRVRAVLGRLVSGASSLDARTSFADVKGWDSLAALRVLVSLEKEFSVVLPAHLFAQHPTLEAVVPAILTNVAKRREAP